MEAVKLAIFLRPYNTTLIMQKKKIIFLTGTRADFGKIKPLIDVTMRANIFEVHIFATGMHLSKKYGYTMNEIKKCGFENIYPFDNDVESGSLSSVLANTINGFGDYVQALQPNLIIVHGDRVEALAGALVGSLNNIIVAHVEGGEVSGTIDEHIRHAISKMSHIHFVANAEAQKRLVQMGESDEVIHVIGSPDLDIMTSSDLPSMEEAKQKYSIPFGRYAILLYHPVTSELDKLQVHADDLVSEVFDSGLNYIVVYPNSDPGSDCILKSYQEHLEVNDRFRVIPSVRFEHFLTLIKHAKFIIGNSSVGIREAPFYGVPSINIGTRQHRRLKPGTAKSIVDVPDDRSEIARAIRDAAKIEKRYEKNQYFGDGNSAKRFYSIITRDDFWNTNAQKFFVDLYE